MSPAGRWWLVSDLHLGMSDDDPRQPGVMLAGFLRHEVLAAADVHRHVVFVGDTVELVRLSEHESLAHLEALLGRHPDAAEAMRECAADGVHLHFVCGNHDVELARPAVAALLSAHLSPAGTAPVRVHPWFLLVPGILVAEHGHQHHPLHRIPEVLRTGTTGSDGLDAAPLAAWNADAPKPRLNRAADLLRACMASERAERRVRGPEYEELLQAESLRLGLDEATVRGLARLSRFRTVSALPVAATRMVLARTGRRAPGAGAPAAADRFARTLDADGSGVPWYICGHTHAARESALDSSATRYVNTGTWSSDVRGHGPDEADRTLFPYALVDVRADGGTTGGLRYFRQALSR